MMFYGQVMTPAHGFAWYLKLPCPRVIMINYDNQIRTTVIIRVIKAGDDKRNGCVVGMTPFWKPIY